MSEEGTWLTQSVQQVALDPRVMGSSPTVAAEITYPPPQKKEGGEGSGSER